MSQPFEFATTRERQTRWPDTVELFVAAQVKMNTLRTFGKPKAARHATDLPSSRVIVSLHDVSMFRRRGVIGIRQPPGAMPPRRRRLAIPRNNRQSTMSVRCQGVATA